MKSIVTKLLGTSPRTTIMGFIKAVFVAMLPIFQKEGFEFKKDWPYLLGAVLLVISGRLQKDSNGITSTEAKAIIKPESKL